MASGVSLKLHFRPEWATVFPHRNLIVYNWPSFRYWGGGILKRGRHKKPMQRRYQGARVSFKGKEEGRKGNV